MSLHGVLANAPTSVVGTERTFFNVRYAVAIRGTPDIDLQYGLGRVICSTNANDSRMATDRHAFFLAYSSALMTSMHTKGSFPSTHAS